jgi:hypothetical protein
MAHARAYAAYVGRRVSVTPRLESGIAQGQSSSAKSNNKKGRHHGAV